MYIFSLSLSTSTITGLVDTLICLPRLNSSVIHANTELACCCLDKFDCLWVLTDMFFGYLIFTWLFVADNYSYEDHFQL